MSNYKKWTLIISFSSFFFLLFLRLVDLQLFRGAYFRSLAEDNRFFSRPVLADRGVIKDRYAEPMTWNERIYYLLDDPKSLFTHRTLIDKTQALSLAASNSAKLSFAYERHYLDNPGLAHILGYVSLADQADLQADQSLTLGSFVGKIGLEQVYQDKLRGVDGQEILEVDALANKTQYLQKNPVRLASALETTIDPYLSKIAAEALGENLGVVIITDGSKGEVLALVSTPGFDANVLSQPNTLDSNFRKNLISDWFLDPKKRFFNRAISGEYPLGSVFKLVTALAGLERGSINESTQVLDEGILKVGDYQYGNWYYRQYGKTEGNISIVRAIARSNDIFFYKTAEWVGPEKLAEFARFFGFGQKTGIELGSEATGLVPDPTWKEAHTGERWFLGNTYHFGIGQGDFLVTPIQVAQFMQILANHGTKCRLHLLNSQVLDCSELALKQADLELVYNGMIQACSPGGTSYPFFEYNQSRYQPEQSSEKNLDSGAVACKTGTAEFGGADEKGYRNTHAWWVGIVDLGQELAKLKTLSPENFSSPERASWQEKVNKFGFPNKLTITVLVESSVEDKFKEGSEDAAPIAKEIIDWIVTP